MAIPQMKIETISFDDFDKESKQIGEIEKQFSPELRARIEAEDPASGGSRLHDLMAFARQQKDNIAISYLRGVGCARNAPRFLAHPPYQSAQYDAHTAGFRAVRLNEMLAQGRVK